MTLDDFRNRVPQAGDVEVERLRLAIGKPLNPRLERVVREVAENAYINGIRHAIHAVETQQDMVPLCELLDEIEGQNWHESIVFKGDKWKNS